MIIYLEDKRRELAGWVSKIQHLFAGIPLFFTGLANFHEEAERPIAIFEIAVALILLLTFVKELRAARLHRATGHQAHSPIGWFDLAASALLIYEAFHGAHTKPGYLRPQFFSGILALALGLFHARIHHFRSQRCYLQLDDAGLDFRLPPFRRLTVPWSGIASVVLTGNGAILELKNGRRHKLNLGRFHNRKALQQALADHTPSELLLT